MCASFLLLSNLIKYYQILSNLIRSCLFSHKQKGKGSGECHCFSCFATLVYVSSCPVRFRFSCTHVELAVLVPRGAGVAWVTACVLVFKRSLGSWSFLFLLVFLGDRRHIVIWPAGTLLPDRGMVDGNIACILLICVCWFCEMWCFHLTLPYLILPYLILSFLPIEEKGECTVVSCTCVNSFFVVVVFVFLRYSALLLRSSSALLLACVFFSFFLSFLLFFFCVCHLSGEKNLSSWGRTIDRWMRQQMNTR